MNETNTLPRFSFPNHADDDPALRPAGDFITAALEYLSLGVQNRRGDFHVISLATTAADGAPRLRSVVLRGYRPDKAEICFHTDARSAKFTELNRDPRAAVLAYDSQARLQIRIEGRVTLHLRDEHSTAIWRGMSADARETYRRTMAPGLPATPNEMDLMIPEKAAIGNFTVCRLRIAAIDVLFLRPGGHRRAVGRYDPADILTARWVAA